MRHSLIAFEWICFVCSPSDWASTNYIPGKRSSTLSWSNRLFVWKFRVVRILFRRFVYSTSIDTPFGCFYPHATANNEVLQHQAVALEQHLANMEDQCDGLTDLCQHKQETAKRLYKFLYENPLRLFLPVGHTFNGRSYTDYEKEYLSWYNMMVPSGDV